MRHCEWVQTRNQSTLESFQMAHYEWDGCDWLRTIAVFRIRLMVIAMWFVLVDKLLWRWVWLRKGDWMWKLFGSRFTTRSQWDICMWWITWLQFALAFAATLHVAFFRKHWKLKCRLFHFPIYHFWGHHFPRQLFQRGYFPKTCHLIAFLLVFY